MSKCNSIFAPQLSIRGRPSFTLDNRLNLIFQIFNLLKLGAP
nr:MAG TPA: hypothetical protein [Caudoviricetes sp.]